MVGPLKHPAGRHTSARARPAAPEPETGSIDSSYLQSLVGYNTRRAALVILEHFGQHMAVYDLRPVDFSILSLITHNPGITSRQLCAGLGIRPPNLVAMVAMLSKRSLIERQPHAHDGRAMSLYLTAAGRSLMLRAEETAAALELQATSALNATERGQLIGLLQKIYM